MIQVSEALGVNLFPAGNEFILGFQKEIVKTDKIFVISGLGLVDILGEMTLWIALNQNGDDDLLTVTPYEGDDVVKTKWFLVDVNCNFILG